MPTARHDSVTSRQANMLACQSAELSCAKQWNLRCLAVGKIVLIFAEFEACETSRGTLADYRTMRHIRRSESP